MFWTIITKGKEKMKQHTITELSDCWLIDGKIEIPKKKKPKTRKIKDWFQDFVFDMFNFYN